MKWIHASKVMAVCSLMWAQASVIPHYGIGAGFASTRASWVEDYNWQGSRNIISSQSASIAMAAHSGQLFGFIGGRYSYSDATVFSLQLDAGFDGSNDYVYSNAWADAQGETDLFYGLKVHSGPFAGISARAFAVRGDYAPYIVTALRFQSWDFSYRGNTSSDYYFSYAFLTKCTEFLIMPELGIGVNVTVSDKIDARLEAKYLFGGQIKFDYPGRVNDYYDRTVINLDQLSVQASVVFE